MILYADTAGERLDAFLARCAENMSRASAQRLIEEGCVTRNGKPGKKNILRAMSDIGVSKEEAIFMGDQVFTDVWAAHNSGIRAILVPPIKDKRDLLTRFKRLLEVPILKKYRKQKEK